jgi:hypothetical protein
MQYQSLIIKLKIKGDEEMTNHKILKIEDRHGEPIIIFTDDISTIRYSDLGRSSTKDVQSGHYIILHKKNSSDIYICYNDKADALEELYSIADQLRIR